MGIFNRNETDYFKLFEEGISFSLKAAEALQVGFADGKIDLAEIQKIKNIEHEADKHVHRCLKLIEEAFITPIDRSDILDLVKYIENVTDSIDEVSRRIYMMRVTDCGEYAVKFVEYIVQACKKCAELMATLKDYKKNLKKINQLAIEVNNIEEAGDRLFTEAMRELFSSNSDPVTIIIKKDLFERFEDILDNCEDVADTAEKIMTAKT